jgi:NAD kinase
MNKAWILYDGRAESGDTDDASVLEFAGTTRREVKSALHFWRGSDGVLVEYDDNGKNELINEKVIGHLREGRALLDRCSFPTDERR